MSRGQTILLPARRQQVKEYAWSRFGLVVGKQIRQSLIRRVCKGDVKYARKLTNSRTVIVLDYDGGEMSFVYCNAHKEIISFLSPDAPETAEWRRGEAKVERVPLAAGERGTLVSARSGEAVLPANVTAEMAILGAVMLNNGHYQEAAGRIEAADFSLDAHRRVFRRMGELMTEGKRVDIVTLAEQLQRNKELSVIGGVAWLASLTEGLPRRLSIEDYVRIVKDKSLLRQTIAESDRVGVLAVDQSGSAEEVLAEAESAFRRIAGKAITAGLTSVAEYIRGQYPCIDKIFEQSARLTGIPSGFCGLDNLTAGFQPKELTILGARPSIGKTAVAGNIAVHVAKLGRTVAFFSLEMPSKALIDRMCCAQGQVDLQAHRHGRLNEVQKQYYLRALADIIDVPLYIDDQPGQTAASIEAKAARLQASNGLDLVVVDYLGLMAAERKGLENREQVVAAISRAMKGLAKRLNVPVILLSQLNRELYKRVDKRPILSDLRESGSIEQDADLVLFLHREEYYNRDDPSLAGKGELIIAKARNGPLGTVRLHYDARTCRWESERE